MNLIKNKRKQLLASIDLLMYIIVYIVGNILSSVTAGGAILRAGGYAVSVLLFAVAIFGTRVLFAVYADVWRYANSRSYLALMGADFFGGAIALLISSMIPTVYLGFWPSASIIAALDMVTLASRFVYQQYYRHTNTTALRMNKIGVAIVGAGQVGAMLAEELIYNPNSHYYPICFIDKNADKIGGFVCGIRVYAEGRHTLALLKTLPVAEIFVALPTIDSATAQKIHEYYASTGCKIKLYDFPFKEGEARREEGGRRVLREIKIEDLLFRDSLNVGEETNRAFYSGKTVLVTGGGGSIGSELCRQIAKLSPKKLIIFDIYENNAYDIQQELLRKYGNTLDLAVEIGSVRDRKRLDAVFRFYRPEIVFHAAAHKHVPLMEHSNQEAIKNNCLGTYNTADMAEKYGAKKFILISTDKAVNPTNVMGASKRMCEMIIQCRIDSATTFAAVRFGNVLGSNGSVIPLFRRQIEAGGPVTVTDKRIIRYFMTIPEASGLVMQAGAMAKKGELFVLDMGKPVKIIELAENMIRLSGLIPYQDVDIVETGLRPGEKLYEELLIKTETLTKTENRMIFIEKDTPFTRAEIEEKITVLKEAVTAAEEEIEAKSVVAAMKRVVPTYRSPEEVNAEAEESEEMKMVEEEKDATEDLPQEDSGTEKNEDK